MPKSWILLGLMSAGLMPLAENQALSILYIPCAWTDSFIHSPSDNTEFLVGCATIIEKIIEKMVVDSILLIILLFGIDTTVAVQS